MPNAIALEILAQSRSRSRAFSWLEALVAIETWLDRRSQRRALLGLDDDALHDIGVSRAEAEREAARWL